VKLNKLKSKCFGVGPESKIYKRLFLDAETGEPFAWEVAKAGEDLTPHLTPDPVSPNPCSVCGDTPTQEVTYNLVNKDGTSTYVKTIYLCLGHYVHTITTNGPLKFDVDAL